MKKLYQNRDWLYKMYRVKMLSTVQIAELVGTCHRTIIYWLQKFNISIRSSGEGSHLRNGNHCKLSPKAREWIEGELLGDGSLLVPPGSCSARFSYGSKYLEYVQYVSDTLKSFGIEQVGRIRERKDKKWNSYSYCSCCYVELLPIRKHWYPEGKKVVPKDLELTSLVCRQWYIGDGCLKHPKRRPYIVLYSEGFSLNNVKWLVEKLNKLGFKATRRKDNNIGISTYSTQDFLDYKNRKLWFRLETHFRHSTFRFFYLKITILLFSKQSCKHIAGESRIKHIVV